MATWRSSHAFVNVVGIVMVCLLVLPIIVLIGVSFNAGVEQVFPPRGFSLRWYANLANRQGFVDAAKLTLLLASGSACFSVLVSLAAGVALTRHRFPGHEVVLTLLLSPLIVPQVVVGMAFLVTLSAMGVFNSLVSLSILHCVITLPFALRVVVAALQSHPASVEEAAQSLGAPPLRAFFGVTVPQIAPGLITAGVFAFVTSFENFTASQFLVWDRTTLPIAIYTSVQTENDPTAAALSALIVLVVVASIVVFNKFVVRHMLVGR
jgi:ABC-type spermidine/putrescine transport system permease subunit II